MRTSLLIGLFAISLTATVNAADDYVPGPDSKPQPGVPQGEVTKYSFDKSKIYPGTTREYWVYVPKQYDPATPACVMVFQDGLIYSATNVFNNLIARKEIPVIIGVFIKPGIVTSLSTNALDRFNRSYEYDGLGDDYARFLLEELLPDVAQKYNLSTNGNDRAIGGSSSGAIAAFTAAWEHPEAFTRVFSSIGTFVGLRGGNEYPTSIRQTEPKPIRVFLQDGSNDHNIYGGNWWLAAQEMLSALEFSGYEVNHVWGDGAHTQKHADAIFPDALRWLWKDYPAPVVAGKGSRQPLMDVLIPGEGWQVASAGHKSTDGPAANAAGEVFFCDPRDKAINKIGLDGKVSVFVANHPSASGLMFGPDGKLYACQFASKRIVSYDADGKETVIAEDAECNDLAVTYKGEIYFTDHKNKKVWFINARGEKRVVDESITFPNGIRLTPDQSLLLVSDTRGQFVYSFQIQPDGSLAQKQRFFHLHIADGSMQSGADGMAVDTHGWLYVTTELGVQICDQAGRVNGIIPKPQSAALSNIVFGGPNHDELYVTCRDKVFKRKTKAQGVLSFQAPIKPPTPKL
ncbi:MAG: gluconolactonase [Pedosphaera sp.]|nr:gluconolactonase [Pedosphaera sp.]